MSQFSVLTPSLAAGAVSLGNASTSARDAEAAVSCLSADPFAGEPIAADFEDLLRRATISCGGLADTLGQLSTNVAAAALGYITTDQGLMPAYFLRENHRYPGAHA